MNASKYLGIDCGTQGTKALVVDANGVALGRGYASHALTESSNGAREQHPQWWIDALCTAVAQATASGPDGIAAIGVSGQQHGLVILDEHKQVIRPAKLWNDTSTASQNAELIQHFGGNAEWFRRFGIIPMTGYTVSKLLWIKQQEPQHFARIRHILLPHEFLNFWLTGHISAEPGDASGTGFFDVRSHTWLHEVLDAIDGGSGQLAAALPCLMPSNGVVGTLLPKVAARLGLRTHCVVSVGGGDNMMGAIGTGNVREGVVTMSLGTSSTVYSFKSSLIGDPTGNVAPFCSSSGGWLPLVCTMNATNVVTAATAMIGKTVADIDAALQSTPPGADGLTFLTFLNGERTPDLPNATGTLTGISATSFTGPHLLRAAVEGVSFGILNGLDLVMAGKPANVIQVIGGGARSAAWRQLLADATGASIQVPAEQEAGCLGAAMQAMVAESGQTTNSLSFEAVADRCVHVDQHVTVWPRPDQRAAYVQARSLYRERLRALYGV